MPTLLEVLLQRRKSAAAEPFHRHATASASAGQRPVVARVERGMERVDSDAGMRGSYINLLTISRADTGTVNGGTTVFAGTAAELPPLYHAVLRGDVAKSVTIP